MDQPEPVAEPPANLGHAAAGHPAVQDVFQIAAVERIESLVCQLAERIPAADVPLRILFDVAGLAALRNKEVVLVIEGLFRLDIFAPRAPVRVRREKAIVVRADAGFRDGAERFRRGQGLGAVEIGLQAGIAQREHSVGWKRIQNLGDDLARVVEQAIGGMVPLAPRADESGFQKREHVGIFAQDRAKLVQVGQYAIERCVGLTNGTEVIGEAADDLDSRGARGGEIGAHAIQHGRTLRASCHSGWRPQRQRMGRVVGLRWLPYDIECLALAESCAMTVQFFDFNRPMTLVTAADGTIAATLRAGRRNELRFA